MKKFIVLTLFCALAMFANSGFTKAGVHPKATGQSCIVVSDCELDAPASVAVCNSCHVMSMNLEQNLLANAESKTVTVSSDAEKPAGTYVLRPPLTRITRGSFYQALLPTDIIKGCNRSCYSPPKIV
jgi:hypothetical protein